MEARRLYRSEHDRMLAGVCGGLGAYLDVDPTLVRVAFVLLGLVSGIGVVAYVAMWIVVPTESRVGAPPREVAREGVADIRERAREGMRQAREALARERRAGAGTPGEQPPGQPSGEAQGGRAPGQPPPERGDQFGGFPEPAAPGDVAPQRPDEPGQGRPPGGQP